MKKLFLAFLAICIAFVAPLSAAPGLQPITAAAYPAQSIITGDLSISAPGLEQAVPAISEGIGKAVRGIEAVKTILAAVLLFLVIDVALSFYSFCKTFLFSPAVIDKPKSRSQGKNKATGRSGKPKQASTRKPRAAPRAASPAPDREPAKA